MDSKERLVSNKFFSWYLGVMTLLSVLPVLAPIFLKLGLTFPSKIIYLVYSFFCHQFAYRSIHLFDYQFAWCSRDTGIWLGVCVVAWLMKLKKIKPIKWYWSIPFIIPIALDGGLQTVFTLLSFHTTGIVGPLYESNNLMRFITGTLFGIGLSLWISGVLLPDEIKEDNKNKEKDLEIVDESKVINEKQSLILENKNKEIIKKIIGSQIFKIFTIFLSLITIYIFLVQLWNITSIVNKPLDFSDSVVRATLGDPFIRRADGICPTKGANDLFNFKCFIK